MSDVEREMERSFRSLEAGLKSFNEVRQVYNEQIAFDFNVLSFFYPNENKISEILAFFLNPEETHGQKDKFLQEFLTDYASEVLLSYQSGTTKVNVKTEECTDANRRIDIVAKVGDEWAIAIENKIWNAPDQKDQMKDYAEYLDNKKGGKFILFYLTPDGRLPSEGSMPKELLDKWKREKRLILLSKDQLVILFKKFEKVCLAENVKVFIREFVAHLKGETIMGEGKFITDFITKKENIELALKIIYSGDVNTVKKTILKNIEAKIQKGADDLELNYELDWNYDKDVELMAFTFRNWKTKTYAFISFGNKNMCNCYYGVLRKDDEKFLDRLKKKYGFATICPNLHCNNNYDEYINWNEGQPWLDMIEKDGENKFLTNLFGKLQKIKSVAETVADELEKEPGSNWRR